MKVYSKHYRGSPTGWTNVYKTNFLVGENSSGKSSFGRLLKIILSTEFQLSNNCVLPKYFTNDFNDYLSRLSSEKESNGTFSLGFISYENEENKEFFGKIATYEERRGDIALKSLSIIDGYEITKLHFEQGEMYRSKSSIKKSVKINSASILLEQFHEKLDRNRITLSLPSKSRPPSHIWNIFINSAEEEFSQGSSFKLTQKAIEMTGQVNHFGPIRTKPERVYFTGSEQFDTEGRASLGKLKKSLSSKIFNTAMTKFGAESGLFEKVDIADLTKNVGKKAFSIKFTKNKKEFYADELGFGISQIIPILIDVIRGGVKSVIIMEQPELHLHPRAQAAFGELLFEFSDLGHNFFVETHSDFIIDRFRYCRKMSKSNNASAAILFFSHRANKNTLTEMILNNDGAFSTNPAKYRDFFLTEQMRLLSAL